MKKQFLFIILAMFSFAQLNAQSQIAMHFPTDNEGYSNKVNTKAKLTKKDVSDFKAEEKKIIKKIQQMKLYPETAMDYNLEGKVVLEVEFDGMIQSVKVARSAGAILDKAALKAVKEYEKHYEAEGNKRVKPMKLYVPFVFEM